MPEESTPTPTPTKREHVYHAQAYALDGDLHRPLKTPVKPQSYVKVPDGGGYLSERSVDYRLEGIFSFRHAYSQVAGNRSLKPGGGWVTLATSVMEGFNVLDVVTADRIVAQISTEYPLDGYVPEVTFLGTRFENLKIAGHHVDVKLDTGFLGSKPANDGIYHGDKGFRERVNEQRSRILKGKSLPDEIGQRYNQLPSNAVTGETIEWSLVQHAEGGYPGTSFGHAIDIPHFGKVYLGVVRLQHGTYQTSVPGDHPSTTISLTMVEMVMGCIGHGKAGGGNAVVNGTSAP
ncbi:MAG TPA: hypothetical protein VHE33_12535 [Acidobacteriaceae bacterium]|nr:hypothetical protein [Acidobacteriaceae bacterium]